MILKASEDNIRKAAELVKQGGLVIYPTDTVYGLGCDPFNKEAIQKVHSTKRRQQNPLPILGDTIENLSKISKISDEALDIIRKIWPGPITFILPKKDLPDLITAGLNTVGVRIPNNRISLRLIDLCGGLLVGTSANLSGERSPLTANQAYDQIGDKVDIVLDGGATEFGRESTVIKLINGKIEVLREGAINSEDFYKILGNEAKI